MNTRSVSAAIGLGLALALASGCSGDSDKKNDGGGGVGGNRDSGSGRDLPIGRDSGSGQTCTYAGQTYQQGESFIYNCVRFTCQGGNNVVQTGGAPCADARSGTDAAGGSDGRRSDGGDAARDGAPEAAGGQDARPPLDTEPVDVGTEPDARPPALDADPEDSAPPEPDLPVAPLTCKDSVTGQEYGLYVQFACGCRICECNPNSTGTGTIINVVKDNCAIDAG